MVKLSQFGWDVGGVMGITTLFDFTKIKIIDTHKMVPKTTVAMFHWVNIDYDIFMKLELKNLKGDSSRIERRLR